MRHSFHPAPPHANTPQQAAPGSASSDSPKSAFANRHNNLQGAGRRAPTHHKSHNGQTSHASATEHKPSMLGREPSDDANLSTGQPRKGLSIVVPEPMQQTSGSQSSDQTSLRTNGLASGRPEMAAYSHVEEPQKKSWKCVAEEAFQRLNLTVKAGPSKHLSSDGQNTEAFAQDMYKPRGLSRTQSFGSGMETDGNPDNATTSGDTHPPPLPPRAPDTDCSFPCTLR